jgi:hypothetical protein
MLLTMLSMTPKAASAVSPLLYHGYQSVSEFRGYRMKVSANF